MAEDEELDSQPAGLRSFWTGTITFGLVTVPVALYSATRSAGGGLRMVGPDDATVRRQYVCSKDGAPLDADDIVRGYEIEKGKFVVVTDEELEAVEPRKSREIDLRLFVGRDEIDPIYFERAYFLVPSGGTNKAYRLLAEVMEKQNRAGIATFVMRAKEYLVAIIAENGILRAETLRFADEVRSPQDVGLPDAPKISPTDIKKVETQIARRSRKLDLHELLDDQTKNLEKLVAAKQKKNADIVREAPGDDADAAEGGEVIDLLAVLSRSLGQSPNRRSGVATASARKPARKSASKKKSATRKRTATKKK